MQSNVIQVIYADMKLEEILSSKIPLTKEILVNNGFVSVYGDIDDSVYTFRTIKDTSYGRDIDYQITIDLNTPKASFIYVTGGAKIENAEIKYLHQLVLALILCGIKKEIIYE